MRILTGFIFAGALSLPVSTTIAIGLEIHQPATVIELEMTTIQKSLFEFLAGALDS